MSVRAEAPGVVPELYPSGWEGAKSRSQAGGMEGDWACLDCAKYRASSAVGASSEGHRQKADASPRIHPQVV